jgi:hypothetical protein
MGLNGFKCIIQSQTFNFVCVARFMSILTLVFEFTTSTILHHDVLRKSSLKSLDYLVFCFPVLSHPFVCNRLRNENLSALSHVTPYVKYIVVLLIFSIMVRSRHKWQPLVIEWGRKIGNIHAKNNKITLSTSGNAERPTE